MALCPVVGIARPAIGQPREPSNGKLECAGIQQLKTVSCNLPVFLGEPY
jgi:hypothetical protein